MSCLVIFAIVVVVGDVRLVSHGYHDGMVRFFTVQKLGKNNNQKNVRVTFSQLCRNAHA